MIGPYEVCYSNGLAAQIDADSLKHDDFWVIFFRDGVEVERINRHNLIMVRTKRTQGDIVKVNTLQAAAATGKKLR